MKYWKELLGIALIIAGFFMALSEDVSLFGNIVGWVFLASFVGWLIYSWFTQKDHYE
jgi:uncharacterized membrane protein